MCGRRATLYLPYLDRYVCDRCLLRMNFRRFRKYMREHKAKRYTLVKSRSSSYYLMRYFFSKGGLEFREGSKGNVVSTTQDELAERVLASVLGNKKFKLGKKIMPMSVIPEREVYRLCSHLKLPLVKRKLSDISKFLDSVEKRRPGVKFSLRKLAYSLKEL